MPGSGLTSASGSQVEATEPQHVVVYDQSTRDASVLAADSFLSILLSKLDGCFDSVAILTGASGAAPLPLGPWRLGGGGAGPGVTVLDAPLLSAGSPGTRGCLGSGGPVGGKPL